MTCRMCILSTERPIICLILSKEKVTVTVYCHAIRSGEVTCPAVCTNEQALDWLNLNSTSNILLRVSISSIDTLTVADHELIVNKAMTILCREEITLNLNALITTAIACILCTNEV